MVSDTQTTAARPAARRALHVGRTRRRTVHIQGRLRFATGIVLVIALATAAFGVEGYMRASRSQRRVAALQADLASLQQRVGADEQAAAGEQRHTRTVVARASAVQNSIQHVNWQLQSVPTEAQLAGLRNQLAGLGNDVAAYAACIPTAPGRDLEPPPQLENRLGQAVGRLFQADHRGAGVGVVLGRRHRALVRFESAT